MKFYAVTLLLFFTSPAFSVNRQQSLQNRAVTVTFIPRTCHEGFESGHPDMQEDGMYWIDPDGHGIGEVPIYVLCEKGTPDDEGVVQHTTTLLHDKEATFEITVCKDPDNICADTNEVTFNYTNASERQMWALAELSGSCHQSIEIMLIRDVLKYNIWWEDRFFEKHFFWDGTQELDQEMNEIHICACGRDNTCLDPAEKCNCDAAVAIPVSDQGLLTDKDLLPVTKLHLGKIEYEGGEATLGRFVCNGRQSLANEDGQPRGCLDLWKLGYTLNGMYTVKNPLPLTDGAACQLTPEKSLSTVYCDFINPENTELVHETLIGTFCTE